MGQTSSEEPRGTDKELTTSEQSIADVVTLETVVNVLIRKGLLSPEELFSEEKSRRDDLAKNGKMVPVQISQNSNGKQKGSWLRRKMRKRRWTRRLGTRLFGWKWRKVKIKTDKEVLRIDANMQWEKIEEE